MECFLPRREHLRSPCASPVGRTVRGKGTFYWDSMESTQPRENPERPRLQTGTHEGRVEDFLGVRVEGEEST